MVPLRKLLRSGAGRAPLATLAAVGVAATVLGGAAAALGGGELAVDAEAWRLVARESGPVNYYRVVPGPPFSYLHSAYRPGTKTAVMGFEVPGGQVRSFHHLAWKWRADVLPRGGDECAHGAEDSAAVVYVTWRAGLKWYTLKYVWSAVGAKGAVCDRKRNLFLGQDTIILESGGPLGAWKDESIDLDAQFKAHFGGDDVPDLRGLAVMSDGDQTNSESSADYAAFVLSP